RAKVGSYAWSTDWRDGRNVRSDPLRSPGGGERGRERVRTRRGDLRARRSAVAEGRPAAGGCQDRYLMTVIATAANPLFSVSRIEIDRPGDTYTVDTLRELRAQRRPDAEFFFIIGADALSGLRTWQSPEVVLSLVHFIGLTRRGHQLAEHSLGSEQFSLMEMPTLDISSSICRERVRAGLPIRYLVPDNVISYISKRGLYRD